GIAQAVLGRVDPAPAHRWRADGTPYALNDSRGDLALSLTAENGKVDLNQARPELLGGLMRELGVSPEKTALLVSAIIAFRTSSDERLGASESEPAARAASAPKHAAFDAIEELQQVAGMTPAIYERLRPYVTV